ncbi:hypothetical protein [Caballeronia sp. SBC2]|uniref:hypothetical protein n=1 Tax=Caballeronia sp. SBC2 TaxID=2705547 RepID=UPI0013E9F52E|nr:hypothetical protein [Caballeronia sp. SBC2]
MRQASSAKESGSDRTELCLFESLDFQGMCDHQGRRLYERAAASGRQRASEQHLPGPDEKSAAESENKVAGSRLIVSRAVDALRL